MTVKAIVTDIEGTTSSLSFVKEVLFPYAREHMRDFVLARQQQPAVRAQLEAVAREAGEPLDASRAAELLIHWIDEDRKITPLKALQGLIWEDGYREGAFQGHIYEDAVLALRRWHQAGIDLYVYSSGSVQAQQLLFAHTAWGDLTPLFRGYFDTRIGAKGDPESYQRILAETGLAADQVLFLSDVPAELKAAAQVGIRVLQLVREPTVQPGPYPTVTDFSVIDMERL